MKILIMANHCNTGGITSYILNLCRGLKEKEHELWLVCAKGDNVDALQEMGVLQQLIPVCPVCKKSSGDQTVVSALESYIQAHPNAKFHDAVCSSCSTLNG